jgi:hypothetical protein
MVFSDGRLARSDSSGAGGLPPNLHCIPGYDSAARDAVVVTRNGTTLESAVGCERERWRWRWR